MTATDIMRLRAREAELTDLLREFPRGPARRDLLQMRRETRQMLAAYEAQHAKAARDEGASA